MNEHLADLGEILVRERPAGKLSELASDRERSKIDADEADQRGGRRDEKSPDKAGA
jgi:hypothetical protein